MSTRISIVVLSFLCLGALSRHSWASSDGGRPAPGWANVRAPLVAPGGPRPARRVLGVQPSSTALEITTEIQELARALRQDPLLIYEFVRNSIEYVPIYGSIKGPTMTWYDGRGNDFDITSLYVALMRASGFTSNFVYGLIRLSPTQVSGWLGAGTDPDVLGALLASAGIPATIFVNGGGSLSFVELEHVWAKTNISGTDYVFDPSFKLHTSSAGMDLATVMGYDRTTFLAHATAGATVDPNYVQNLNRANMRADLATLAGNLVDHVRTTASGATLADVIGGREIVSVRNAALRTTLSYERARYFEWTEIPTAYAVLVRVQHIGIDQTLSSSAVYGKRFSVVYGAGGAPELRVDGSLIATGSASTSGNFYPLTVTVDHPYAALGGTYCDQTVTMTVKSGGTFTIMDGFAETQRGSVEKHRKVLQQQLFDGDDPAGEPVRGETLTVIGDTWLAENAVTVERLDRIARTMTIQHHTIGVCGQVESPYVDIPGVLVSVVSTEENPDRESAVFFALAGVGSSFESGVFEQTQPFSAVCTVKLVDISSAKGDKVFDATSANYLGAVKPQLVNYSAPELALVEAYVNAGFRLVLPQDGNLNEGQWTGIGFISISPGENSIGHIISGALAGGYGSQTGDADPGSAGSTGEPGDQSGQHSQSHEPIDLFAGDYLYEHTDLAVGSAPFPFGFGFTRSYSTGSRLTDGALGLGWTHNFDARARVDTDGFQGLGEDSPVDAAGVIAELFVAQDVLQGSKTALKLSVATLSHRWFIERLIKNLAVVQEPRGTWAFVALPDGSYNPPPGSADTLTKELDGTFLLRTKKGALLDYDSGGRLATWQDPNGNSVTFSYSVDQLASVSNGMGRTLTLGYSGTRISSVSDGNGRTVSYSYDASGNLVAATDPASHTTTYQYDAGNRMVSFYRPQNPADPYVTNTYDALGRVMQQTDAVGNTYEYFFSGRRAEEEDPLHDSLVWYFDRLGQTVLAIDQLGKETSFQYDGQKRLVREVFPEGNSSEYVYDSDHNPTRVTVRPKPPSSDPALVKEHTYEPLYGNVVTTTDYEPSPRTTAFSYDASGNLIRVDRPSVGGNTPVLTFTYNGRGQLLTYTDPDGLVTRHVYSATTGDLLTTILDDGGLASTTQMAYDAVGDVAEITDPRGNTTSYQFDALRHVEQIVQPAPFQFTTRHQYDANGNLLSIERETGDGSNPWQTRTMTYTLADRLASETDDDGHTTTYQYDARNRRSRVTDAELDAVEYAYDAAGRPSTVTDGRGIVVEERSYTPNGQAATLKDGNGHVTTYTWDAFDRLSRTTFADGSYELYQYDGLGNMLQMRTRAGLTIALGYDELNRMTSKVVPGPGGTSIQYAYDLAGRLMQVSDENGPIQFVYDDAGRPTQVVYPGGATLGYAYDAMGNRTRLDYSDGYFVTYEYDALNRMTAIRELGTTLLAQYGYDSLSRRTSVALGNGTSASYQYEPDDDVSQIDYQFNGDSRSLAYTYDGVGNRTSVSAASGTISYGYDGAHQLTTVTDSGGLPALVSYGLDGAGNRTTVTEDGSPTTFSANVLNQYAAVGGKPFSYDANGNLTVDRRRRQGYTYDGQNRLVAALTAVGLRARYAYDPFGRRVSRRITRPGLPSGTSTLTSYLYDEGRVIEEFDDAGQLARRYVYGSALDEPIRMSTGAASYYYHFDALGSVVYLSDASGQLAESYAYDAYGRVDGPSAVGNPYLFTGQRYDPETKLYFYRARSYDPFIGRFLQSDPVGYGDGLNLYRYARNNPQNLVDPTGEWALIDNLIAAGVGAVGGIVSQGVSDLITGNLSSWETYAGSAAGGVVSAEVMLQTGNPWLAGAAGGETSSLTRQGLENLSSYVTTGNWKGFDAGDVVESTIFGGLTDGALSKVPLEIPGITTGRNSYGAIYNQIITKLENGTIDNVSAKTIAKMLGYKSIDDLPSTLIGGELDGLKEVLKQFLENK